MEDRLMSANALFDSPGPNTRARHRMYAIASVSAILGALAFSGWRLYDAGQFAYRQWEPFFTPQYIEALLVDGLVQTVKMAFTAIIGAVVFGVIFGIAKLSEHRWIRLPAWAVVEFFRAVPLILLMVFCFYAVFNNFANSSYLAVVGALTLYNGAVLAEVFRAGINAVPKGQAEAAYAMGMRKSQVMGMILLPQAVKIMLPAIISQCVVALKDTSLGYIVVAPGLTRVAKSIFQQFSNHVPTMIVIALFYIVTNLILTWVATWVQKKFVGEKEVLSIPIVGTATP
jgi:glutamate transport system permease protein